MSHLVVIGGSGFLGRQLIAQCDDWTVTSVDRVPFGAERPAHVREIVADAHDRDALLAACQGADVVWIRAGLLGGAASISLEHAPQYLHINTELVRDVLAACEQTGTPRVLFDSSEQVWGNSGDLEYQRADSEPVAGNFYGASKLIAEKMLRYWSTGAPNRSVQIFRYSRVRGPATRDVLYHMASACVRGAPVRIVGNPAHRVSFVHVEDVIAANRAALRLEPRFAIYQVSADRPYALWDLARLVRDMAGAAVPLQFETPAQATPFEPFVVGMEWEESARRLGVAPQWSVAAMIQETLSSLHA